MPRCRRVGRKGVWLKPKSPVPLQRRFPNRKLGLMDYYELKNVQADTDMRQTIAGHSTMAATSSRHQFPLCRFTDGN
ncbi:MAG: hypothetical protein Ct9H300mP1_25060 [Planctomycetaceae bacterium]|nr:MAG: hypothetical protein Ct9H300mP1_25060 [Planctomycetaceae bacterium]